MSSEIIGYDLNNKRIKIIPNHWSFMQMGQGHIILENNNKSDPLFDKVLSVCRHQIHSIPSELQNIYTKILSNVQEIKQFLIERDQIFFQTQQTFKIVAMMKSIIDLPIQKCKVFMAQNLTRSNKGWDYCLEFKPKTILPDCYSKQFIREYSIKNQLDAQKLICQLTNCSAIQKTRWFKKNCLKDVKKNLNPFEIFSFTTSNCPNFLKKVKGMKDSQSEKTPRANPPKQSLTNQKIFQVVNNTNVLSIILRLQLLFTEPHDFKHINVYDLWKHQFNKQSICEFVYDKILAELKSNQPIQTKLESLFGEAPNCQNSSSFQRSEIEKIIRFLISWTWKDVSLIVRLKLSSNEEEISEFDLKIIDYELKEAAKLANTIKKDEKFLSQYLLYKKLL